MKRENALVGIGVVGLGALGVALALARCTDGEPRRVESAHPPEPTQLSPADVSPGTAPEIPPDAPHEPGVAPAPGADTDAEPVRDAGAALSPPEDARVADTPGNSVLRALGASQPADRELLGRIERELHREPPAEVHAMLRRRDQGASRDELLDAARALPDLELRVLALRWVDQVRPAAGASSDAGAPGRSPRAPTASSANPFVKRVEPVR